MSNCLCGCNCVHLCVLQIFTRPADSGATRAQTAAGAGTRGGGVAANGRRSHGLRSRQRRRKWADRRRRRRRDDDGDGVAGGWLWKRWARRERRLRWRPASLKIRRGRLLMETSKQIGHAVLQRVAVSRWWRCLRLVGVRGRRSRIVSCDASRLCVARWRVFGVNTMRGGVDNSAQQKPNRTRAIIIR